MQECALFYLEGCLKVAEKRGEGGFRVGEMMLMKRRRGGDRGAGRWGGGGEEVGVVGWDVEERVTGGGRRGGGGWRGKKWEESLGSNDFLSNFAPWLDGGERVVG